MSDLSTLITPARYLFNAGDTPKDFNEFILNSNHFNPIYFEANASKIFPRTDIKGGVAIYLFDKKQIFDPINLYIPYKELQTIDSKVCSTSNKYLSDIVYPANKLILDNLYSDYPNAKKQISSGGKERRLQSNIFKLDAFHKINEVGDYGIIGLQNNKRQIKYISSNYIDDSFNNNIDSYKVLLPKSNGSGMIGEQLSTPLIGEPLIGYTYSFIGIGKFRTEIEAESLLKYIKTKFARVMLGILKVTQDNTKEKWNKVPMQDFTENSDIDWSKSVAEIDQQLYKKYGLSEDEINFIETKVQDME